MGGYGWNCARLCALGMIHKYLCYNGSCILSKQSKIPAAELAIFCQELYQLVQSGLPIADGLNMLL